MDYGFVLFIIYIEKNFSFWKRILYICDYRDTTVLIINYRMQS